MWLSIQLIAYMLFATLCISDDEYEYHTDNDVAVLNESTFDDFLRVHPTALVMFYAPWCGHCQKFLPEYEKAASLLSDEVPFGKVDATVETGLAKKYDVEGYPTVKFWNKKEEPVDYDGVRDSQGIVNWIKQRTDPNYKPLPEQVVTLTDETFDEFLAKYEFALVMFYAPWCTHCKALAPNFEKAAQLLEKENNVKFAKLDATAEKKIAKEYDITSFPTLKFFRNGRRYDFQGGRDPNGIKDAVLRLMEPAAKQLYTVKEAERFMQKFDPTIIGFFKDESSALLETLRDAAERTRESFSIGWTTNQEVIDYFKAKPSEVVLFQPQIFWSEYEPRRVPFAGESLSTEDLLTFLRDNSAPLVGQMNARNSAVRYTKWPLVVVYYDLDFSHEYEEGTQYWRKKVLRFAEQYRKDYKFAIADENEYAKELEELGLGASGLEQNVVAFGYDGKKYVMNPDEYDGSFEENFAKFMKNLSSGRVKPFVKSAALPREDKGPVKTVVGSNFVEVVFDETKDVLLEMYAPWCGHCKAFEPKYKQLASKLKTEEPNLLLVKMDATSNDAPMGYEVSGFPTLYFAPSGKKDKPIRYEGKRDLDDLISFLKKHAVMSFQKTEL